MIGFQLAFKFGLPFFLPGFGFGKLGECSVVFFDPATFLDDVGFLRRDVVFEVLDVALVLRIEFQPGTVHQPQEKRQPPRAVHVSPFGVGSGPGL